MALSGILTEAEIAACLQSCQAADTFNYKTFFVKVGLNSKSKDQLTKTFSILKSKLKLNSKLNGTGVALWRKMNRNFLLQSLLASARALTDAEPKAFLAAGDSDGEGKIGLDEFQALVKS